MILGPASHDQPGPAALIVGASTRAAAFSARRAGLRVVCCDQFADADLQAVATVTRVGADPADFVAAAALHPGLPVIYTGGLENHPEILEQLATDRPLWGMSADVVRAVRDPLAVAHALTKPRLPHLEVRGGDSPPAADGTWLLKPWRSAGGRGIIPWSPSAADSPLLRRPHYFQRRAEGSSYSGVFIAQGAVGDVRFVGLTEQIIGEPALNGTAFSWCGNIGPVALPIEVESSIRRIANYLKWKFQLRGLFGLDFIVSKEGKVGVTEINPRYPASLEILEFATGTPLMRDHVECFGQDLDLPPVEWSPVPNCILGKAVIYSSSHANLNSSLVFDERCFSTWPDHADVTPVGSEIAPGQPVRTVYARGTSAGDCRDALLARAAEVTHSI